MFSKIVSYVKSLFVKQPAPAFVEHPLPFQPHKEADGSLSWDGYTEAQLLENVKVQTLNVSESRADPNVDPHVRDAEGYIATGLTAALSKITGIHQPWKEWVKLATGKYPKDQ